MNCQSCPLCDTSLETNREFSLESRVRFRENGAAHAWKMGRRDPSCLASLSALEAAPRQEKGVHAKLKDFEHLTGAKCQARSKVVYESLLESNRIS